MDLGYAFEISFYFSHRAFSSNESYSDITVMRYYLLVIPVSVWFGLNEIPPRGWADPGGAAMPGQPVARPVQAPCSRRVTKTCLIYWDPYGPYQILSWQEQTLQTILAKRPRSDTEVWLLWLLKSLGPYAKIGKTIVNWNDSAFWNLLTFSRLFYILKWKQFSRFHSLFNLNYCNLSI